jgi:glucosyl-3-phosphoglycerate phosphatase
MIAILSIRFDPSLLLDSATLINKADNGLEQALLAGFLYRDVRKALFGAKMLLVRHGQSEFNAIFSKTRVDPGIPDPKLTDEGRAQARAAANHLAGHGVTRLIASPYTRAIQTAEIIAQALGLTVTIDALVRERAAFHCDIGTPKAELQNRFPDLSFAHLDEPWWHDHVTLGYDESEEQILARGRLFRDQAAALPDRQTVAVVTHWGFIRAVTGIDAKNAEILRLQFD